jgi:hypothetical protein
MKSSRIRNTADNGYLWQVLICDVTASVGDPDPVESESCFNTFLLSKIALELFSKSENFSSSRSDPIPFFQKVYPDSVKIYHILQPWESEI